MPTLDAINPIERVYKEVDSKGRFWFASNLLNNNTDSLNTKKPYSLIERYLVTLGLSETYYEKRKGKVDKI